MSHPGSRFLVACASSTLTACIAVSVCAPAASAQVHADVQNPEEKTSSLYPGSSYIENARTSSSPLSSDLSSGILRAPRGSSDLVPHGAIVLPPELTPVGPTGPSGPRTVDDFLAAGAVVSDYLGDEFSVRNWLALMSPQRRALVGAVLAQLNSPVTPPPADATGPIVVLGGGVNGDGSLPRAVVMRLEKALELANARPESTVLISGGRTPAGHVEALVMSQWLMERGIDENRIVAEGRSWSTVSNAWHSRRVADDIGLDYSQGITVVTNDFHLHRGVVNYTVTFGPDVKVYGVAGGSPIAWNDAEQRKKAYRDAILGFVAPNAIVADGALPYGAQAARPF